MKGYRSLIVIACILLSISIAIYVIHYLIFHDLHHVFIYMVGDLAFLPLEVLIVGIVVERILSKREKEEKLQKLNMVIGAFFSEVGNHLLATFFNASDNREIMLINLNVTTDWKEGEFKRAKDLVNNQKKTKFDKVSLSELRAFLLSKRAFMLALIENPNLLEHERFTDLLLAVFHLTEELESRPSLDNLPPKDIDHINSDMDRAYRSLVYEWLDYILHLKTNYPFLYSHYLRIHPFQPHPSAIIQ